MRTNREQYDYYWRLIDERDSAEVAKIFPRGVPKQFFYVAQYSAEPRNITSISRYRKGMYRKDGSGRISKDDVAMVMLHADGWVPPLPEEILVHYQERRSHGVVSGAERLSKIIAVDGMAWTTAELESEVLRRKELYEPREGHTPCVYCSKQNPPTNLAEGTVIYRTNGGVGRKTGLYCKDKPCASYDQMGHEG